MPRGEVDEVGRLERGHDDERARAIDHRVDERDDAGDMAHRHREQAAVVLGQLHHPLCSGCTEWIVLKWVSIAPLGRPVVPDV